MFFIGGWIGAILLVISLVVALARWFTRRVKGNRAAIILVAGFIAITGSMAFYVLVLEESVDYKLFRFGWNLWTRDVRWLNNTLKYGIFEGLVYPPDEKYLALALEEGYLKEEDSETEYLTRVFNFRCGQNLYDKKCEDSPVLHVLGKVTAHGKWDWWVAKGGTAENTRIKGILATKNLPNDLGNIIDRYRKARLSALKNYFENPNNPTIPHPFYLVSRVVKALPEKINPLNRAKGWVQFIDLGLENTGCPESTYLRAINGIPDSSSLYVLFNVVNGQLIPRPVEERRTLAAKIFEHDRVRVELAGEWPVEWDHCYPRNSWHLFFRTEIAPDPFKYGEVNSAKYPPLDRKAWAEYYDLKYWYNYNRLKKEGKQHLMGPPPSH